MPTTENYERLIAGIEAETERCKRAQAALPTLKRDLAHAKEGLRLRLRADRGADVSNYKNLIAQIEYEQTMGKDAKKRLPTLRKDLAHAKAGLKALIKASRPKTRAQEHREWLAGERALWVMNDEGLYNRWLAAEKKGLSLESFVRRNMTLIDSVRRSNG